MNDSVFELSEEFTASISLVEASDIVELMPKSVSVTIIDNDGTILFILISIIIDVVIYDIVPFRYTELEFGFNSVEYEVHERGESVAIEIFFVHGNPGDYQPQVFLSTHNGTAKGQILHEHMIFTANHQNQCPVYLYFCRRRDRFCCNNIVRGHIYCCRSDQASSRTHRIQQHH